LNFYSQIAQSRLLLPQKHHLLKWLTGGSVFDTSVSKDWFIACRQFRVLSWFELPNGPLTGISRPGHMGHSL